MPQVLSGQLTLDDFLYREVRWSQGLDLPAGNVPHTTYWLLDHDGRLVGMSRLRHRLNERLLEHGGHVGYYVRRDSRGKGYGMHLLALLLQKARDHNIDRVLLTVGITNVPSWRLIAANGGVTEDERVDESVLAYRRYWIDLRR